MSAQTLLATPQIQVGGTIPAHDVKELAPDASSTLVLKGRNIIVGVPGAYTGTCHAQVPQYLDAYDEFKAKGVNEIYVVAVNDAFVTKAWKENLAPKGSNVHFIADDKAAFAGSLGLLFDGTPVFGGPRSKRYVIVTDDDKVASLDIEADPGKITVTAAKAILSKL
ncbi:putative peroxiredoxin pmp20 [Hypsizygus marmoreus]|uniref:Peroxiredoxin pmp20 n=1 Tax=Hypsizygus marmoreus TaxID=39966 RepID=A0A369JSH6_HYPMA|nr:putative peroxiredoxin pmp20 [Hypsizygus marmoreus]